MPREREQTPVIYKINELFRSIQGEGIYQGQATLFVRFTGCNLRCSWCDTSYAYEEGREISIDELISEIERYGDKKICLTGGEPLLQEYLGLLVYTLLNRNFNVNIETNGSQDLEKFLVEIQRYDPVPDWRKRLIISMDVKTPSSGEENSFLKENLQVLQDWDQIKFVVNDQKDLKYAVDFAVAHRIICAMVIQPSDMVEPRLISELFLKSTWPSGVDARLILQSHKIIWGKNERGV